MATREKEGMPTGLYVTHPITGAEVEVWVGNYVLMTYGDGAVMGVPAHDAISPSRASTSCRSARSWRWPAILRPGLAGMVRRQAVRPDDQFRQVRRPVAQGSRGRHRRRPGRARPGREADHLAPARLGHLAPALLGRSPSSTARIAARCRSREDLPVVLPDDLIPDGSGNPLAKNEAFLSCACPSCGKPARRETDTMDTFGLVLVLHAHTSPGNDQAMVDGRNDYWMPMDQYIGGTSTCTLHLARPGGRTQRLLDADGPVHRRIEHAVLHLLRPVLDQGHARHGHAQLRSPSCCARAWC